MSLYKKVEAMLYNYKKTKVKIKNILIEIKRIENNYKGISAVQYSDMPKAHNANSSVELELENKEKRIDYLKAVIYDKENELMIIDNVLNELSQKDRYIIEEYYFQGSQLRDICAKVDLEETYLSKYKNKLIRGIEYMIFT